MIYLRKASERGHANHGWLKTWHSFSFADYWDPDFEGFSVLRVINEDFVAPGNGFPTHPHRDMEILTYILEGTIEHKDSMGNREQIRAGEFQIMSAGTGVQHSEYNPDRSKPLHLYQIWIRPERNGITPRYEQQQFDKKPGKQVILSPDSREGSLKVYQDMTLTRWILTSGDIASISSEPGRMIWVQVVKGNIRISGQKATESDAFAIVDETNVNVEANSDSDILVFDLPPSRTTIGPLRKESKIN